MKLLITGGAGFIGSAVIRYIIRSTADNVVNVDKLTYAVNVDSLVKINASERYTFEHIDICGRSLLDWVFREHHSDALTYLAAERHVDRSNDDSEVFDVAVDLRQGTSIFGEWVGETLSEDNQRMLWVPPGFAHGFLVTSETADFQYKCTDFYAPEYERCIRWDDPDIGID